MKDRFPIPSHLLTEYEIAVFQAEHQFEVAEDGCGWAVVTPAQMAAIIKSRNERIQKLCMESPQ